MGLLKKLGPLALGGLLFLSPLTYADKQKEPRNEVYTSVGITTLIRQDRPIEMFNGGIGWEGHDKKLGSGGAEINFSYSGNNSLGLTINELFFNLYKLFNYNKTFQPYIGLGIGGAILQNETSNLDDIAIGTSLFGGLNFQIAKTVSLYLESGGKILNANPLENGNNINLSGIYAKLGVKIQSPIYQKR